MYRPASLLALGLAAFLTSGCGGGDGGGNLNPPPADVESITISPAGTDIVLGQTAQLTATAHDAAGNDLSDRAFTWSSSNLSVASVPTGTVNPVTVTSIATGTATITATSEGKSEGVVVEVKPGIDVVVVTGRVTDGVTNQGIAGATVEINRNTEPAIIFTLTTGADGSYTTPAFDRYTSGIFIRGSATGYATGRIFAFNFTESATNTAPTLPLAPASSLNGGISGTVRNARTGEPLPGSFVELTNHIDRSKDQTRETDASGAFSFTQLPAGTYDLGATNECCARQDLIAIVVGDGGIISGQDIALSPRSDTETRVVLTWGAAPADLDAHLTGPTADATRFHVYYPPGSRGNLTGPPFAALDLDDVSSFGPETITITQVSSGVYRYSVHDFTNRNSATSNALGTSGAKVDVYVGGFINDHFTYYVPNQPGTLWTVFELSSAGAGPVVTPINQMGLAEDPAGVSIRTSGGGTDAGLIGRAVKAARKR